MKLICLELWNKSGEPLSSRICVLLCGIIVTTFLLIQAKRMSSLASAAICKLCGNTVLLSKVDMEESGDVLHESDVMIVEDFLRIMEDFQKQRSFILNVL